MVVLLIVVLIFTHFFGCIWWTVGYSTIDDKGWQFDDKVITRAPILASLVPTRFAAIPDHLLRSETASSSVARFPQVAATLLEYEPYDSTDPYLIMTNTAGVGVLNTTHLRYLLDNEVTMPKKYVTSLYWSLTMVMKSPWLAPSNHPEQIYAILVLIMGAMLFAAFIGNFTTTIASYDKTNALYFDTINTLHSFFKTRPHMTTETRKKAYRYAQAYFKQTIGGVAEQTVIANLPEHLRPALLLELHFDLIMAAPWLQETSFACCADFLHALRPEILLRGDTLLKAGVISRNFYIMMNGELRVSFPPEGAKLSKLSQMLGEGNPSLVKATKQHRSSARVPQGRIEKMGSLIGWGPPHGVARPLSYSASAGRDTQLQSIARSKLAEILETHPMEAAIFKRASEHATKLINPIKKAVADSDGEENLGEDHMTVSRRCSTNEMVRQTEGLNGRASCAGGARNTKSSSQSRMSTSADDMAAMAAAKEGGWLRSIGGLGTPPVSAADESFKSSGSNGLIGLSLDEKMSVLFDEVISMKHQLAEQASETAQVRKLLESNRNGLGA